MAPANEYLTDETAAELASHNNRLVKRTTIEFPGEEPEVHWDFHRPVEQTLLVDFLDRFAEPDFEDGKVTITDATESTYGGTAEYLLGRVAGMLQPGTGFNKEHAVNGRVFIVNRETGIINRVDRTQLGELLVDSRGDIARARVRRTAVANERGLQAALRKAVRTDPDHRDELEARLRTRMEEIRSGLWDEEQ